MHRMIAANNDKIVDESATGIESLGADSGAAGLEIGGGDCRYQSLQRPNKAGLAVGSQHFLHAGLPVAAGESPEPGEGEGFGQFRRVDGGLTVAFPRPGQDRIGPSFPAAVQQAGEMDPQEGETRIWHWIDEVVHQISAGCFQERSIRPETVRSCRAGGFRPDEPLGRNKDRCN